MIIKIKEVGKEFKSIYNIICEMNFLHSLRPFKIFITFNKQLDQIS